MSQQRPLVDGGGGGRAEVLGCDWMLLMTVRASNSLMSEQQQQQLQAAAEATHNMKGSCLHSLLPSFIHSLIDSSAEAPTPSDDITHQ